MVQAAILEVVTTSRASGGFVGKKKPPTETVRISKDLARKIRVASAHLDMTVPDYIADRLTPIADADYAKAGAEITKSVSKPPTDAK